ncbi:Uncharacterised protein [Klebsiella michiganensis]|nr:Uncharacterised protein [Klebsiella michiganensis]
MAVFRASAVVHRQRRSRQAAEEGRHFALREETGRAFGEAVGGWATELGLEIVSAPLTLWPQTSMVPPASVKRISATRIWCRPKGSSRRSPVPKIIGPKSPALLMTWPRALIPMAKTGQISGMTRPTRPRTTVVIIGTSGCRQKRPARRAGGYCENAHAASRR